MNQNWGLTQRDAFIGVAEALNSSGVHWVVLRNYLDLPDRNSSRDIDIAVPREHQARARRIIDETLRQLGFEFKKVIGFSFCVSSVYISIRDETVESIKIDLFWGLELNGFMLADAEQLYRSAVQLRGFRGAGESISSVFNWITSIVSAGVIRDKYFDPLVRAYGRNPHEVRDCLDTIMPLKMRVRLEGDLRTLNLDGIRRYLLPLRRAIWIHCLRARPLSCARNIVVRKIWRAWQFLNNSGGAFVSFHGADGSGKTTSIHHFARLYADTFAVDVASVSVRHFRPRLFPNIRTVLGGRNYDGKAEEFDRPHRGKPKGYLTSLMALGYYYIDYLLGHLFQTKPQIMYHSFVIFDRYVYDLVADPRRSRIGIPLWVRRLFAIATPRPPISFFLDAPPELIYSRKQELTIAAIGSQNESYRALARDFTQFVVLNAEKPAAEVAFDAFVAFVEKTCVKLEKGAEA